MSMYLCHAHLERLAAAPTTAPVAPEAWRVRHRRIADAAARAAVDHWRRR